MFFYKKSIDINQPKTSQKAQAKNKIILRNKENLLKLFTTKNLLFITTL